MHVWENIFFEAFIWSWRSLPLDSPHLPLCQLKYQLSSLSIFSVKSTYWSFHPLSSYSQLLFPFLKQPGIISFLYALSFLLCQTTSSLRSLMYLIHFSYSTVLNRLLNMEQFNTHWLIRGWFLHSFGKYAQYLPSIRFCTVLETEDIALNLKELTKIKLCVYKNNHSMWIWFIISRENLMRYTLLLWNTFLSHTWIVCSFIQISAQMFPLREDILDHVI